MQFNLVGAMVAKKEGVNSDTPAAELQRRATTLNHCTAAVIGGSIISVLVTPMEGVKARLQVQYAAGGKGAGVGGVIYKGQCEHCDSQPGAARGRGVVVDVRCSTPRRRREGALCMIRCFAPPFLYISIYADVVVAISIPIHTGVARGVRRVTCDVVGVIRTVGLRTAVNQL